MSTAEAIQVEAAPLTDAAALEGSSTSRYVSGWEFDSLSQHNVVFEHLLGAIPSALMVLFSQDKKTVYPLLWSSWGASHVGNPVSIWMDDKTITLSISPDAPLHGWWDATTGEWTTTDKGYWQVIASTQPALKD